MTPRSLLKFFGEARGMTRDQIDQRMGEVISLCRLETVLGKPIGKLSKGYRQRVGMAQVLLHEPEVLILDEPTAVLTPDQIESLFATLRRIRAEGCAVVFISHKIDEVMRLCDRVTVLRRGRSVLTDSCDRNKTDKLVEAIVGAEGALRPPETPETQPGGVTLELSHVSTAPQEDGAALNDVCLSIRAGEIVGIAGVEGNGQQALIECVLGLCRPTHGTMIRPRDRVAYIANDRHRGALVLSMSVDENTVLRTHGESRFSRHGVLRRSNIHNYAARLIKDFDVRCHDSRSAIESLSGGNQQKLIAARELDGEPVMVVAGNPTRGLDIVATSFLHWRIRSAAARGAGVLLISADLAELTQLSNRIMVLRRGRLLDADWPNGGLARIGRLMSGAAS